MLQSNEENSAFNLIEFREMYAQFENVSDNKLKHLYRLSILIFAQSDNQSQNRDAETKESLLWLLVCHLASLDERGNDLVGSLSNASAGSVSTSFEITQQFDAAWFNQTQCGASYRQIVQPYPKARYYAGK